MDEVQEKLDTFGLHTDIDDNCPMTGDDTDDNTYQDGSFSDLAGRDSVAIRINGFYQEESEEDVTSPTRKYSDLKLAEDLTRAYTTTAGDLGDEEDESFSSDLHDFSDEETSSLAGSYDDLGEEDSTSDQPGSEQSREEKLERLALRRHLDQLGEMVVEREYAVQQARDELDKCREHLEQLERDVLDVDEQIKNAEESNNKASYYRLKSKRDTLTTEINIEKEVQIRATKAVEEAEFHLAQAYIEHGKFIPLDEELEKGENLTEKQKHEKASARIKKELASVALLERKRRVRDKEHLNTVRERERKNRQAVIAAKKNREVAMKYLKETMSRVRQRESEEEEDKSRTNLHQRMNALLDLKKNIEKNKENIKSIQARDRHHAEKEMLQEKVERQQILQEGGNPDEILTRRKRLRQFERDKEAFERKQREKEIGIVNKVLSEEKQLKKRYQQQPQLWPDRPRRVPRRRSKPRFALSSGSESMEYSADVEDTGGRISQYSRLNKVSTDEEGEFSPYGVTCRDDKNGGYATESGTESEETLARPEFEGLWGENIIKKNEDVSSGLKKTTEYSKYEQEMMKNALLKQKANIVQKQVAAGREFKGAAFYSKPEVITFKDFDVGKTYKRKVLLTNVSYTQNYCKLIGISDGLKNFLDVLFDPPGSMSAGLTCDFLVTFKPKINSDLEGHIEFMAQTGIFYVQVRCFTKKCVVSLDTDVVDFGNQVVGETRKKLILLKNDGALGTKFSFVRDFSGEESDGSDDNLHVMSSSIRQSTSLVDQKIIEEPEESGNLTEDDDCTTKTETEETENNESTIDSIKEPSKTKALKVGKITEGYLSPFSTAQLEIIFSPIEAGLVSCCFHVTLENSLTPLKVDSKGNAIDLPVWVERELVDMRICMFDRLYQDAIVVNNRATAALRLRFEIPKELRNHLDILPKTAYIQAESTFSAHLKFLPRLSLPEEAVPYFDSVTGTLEVPVTIRVADQTQPVSFTVKAVVTSSDFEFNVREVNFGYSTVYESVVKTVKLLNKSVLPQPFGFVNKHATIDVQPNDGFGTILPNEELELDLILSPEKAQEYSFDLICKSGIGREFKLPCKATGVLPPLKLSHWIIKFRATAVHDTSATHVFVLNDHLSTNEFTHPVPRIGAGEIFPVGPTSFEFIVPKDAPFSISPKVGTVNPGQKTMIHIVFTPTINKQDIEDEGFRIRKINPSQIELEVKSDNGGENKDNKGKGKQAKIAKVVPEITEKVDTNLPVGDDAPLSTKELSRAHLSLMRNYTNIFQRFKIPCFIAYGECGDPGTLDYNVHNTLYLQIDCPSVRPSLIVVSDTGDNVVHFGKVSMGQRHTQVISVQNISDKTLQLKSSLLDPLGPFEMVNALRSIEPDAIHSIKLSFTPQESKEFFESLEISCSTCAVQVKLKGEGVEPSIELDPACGLLDVGDALSGDSITSILKITNTSELSMVFDLQLGSLSSERHSRTQTLPPGYPQFKHEHDDGPSYQIGPPNHSGVCVFGCKPSHATLQPGECREVEISFSPDHVSELYRDELSININGQVEFKSITLTGRAWQNIIYARGWDRLQPLEESVAAQIQHEKDDDKHGGKGVLLSFHSTMHDNVYSPCERLIDIGCIKSSTQVKKSCDFSFENLKEASDVGFTVDPQKGGVDIGLKKAVTFKWTPPKNFDPNCPAKATIQLILRGDTVTQYKIMLRGYAVTTVDNGSD